MTKRQREVLLVVERHDGNLHAAARELNITRSTLYAMMTRIDRNLR